MSPFLGLGSARGFCLLRPFFRIDTEDQPHRHLVAIRQLHNYVRDFPRIAFRTPFEPSQYLEERTDRCLVLGQQVRRILTGAPCPVGPNGTLPAGDVFRARLILALADGSRYREIARSLRTSVPTIARWKMRFEGDGLAGSEGRHLGSKPRAATPKVQARVIRRVQQPPGDGRTHWSCRK